MSNYFRRMARVAEASPLKPARTLFRPSAAPIEPSAPGIFEMSVSPNVGTGLEEQPDKKISPSLQPKTQGDVRAVPPSTFPADGTKSAGEKLTPRAVEQPFPSKSLPPEVTQPSPTNQMPDARSKIADPISKIESMPKNDQSFHRSRKSSANDENNFGTDKNYSPKKNIERADFPRGEARQQLEPSAAVRRGQTEPRQENRKPAEVIIRSLEVRVTPPPTPAVAPPKAVVSPASAVAAPISRNFPMFGLSQSY